MRFFIASLALMVSAGLAGTALAAEDGEQSDQVVQEDVVAADDVGQQQDEKGRKGKSGKRGKGGPKGRRGGRAGHGPPKPEVLFEKFDKNKDGQLSREEFMALSESMRKFHGRPEHGKKSRGGKSERNVGPRDGKRPGPPPREGRPPRESRQDFRGSEQPLRNPGDRPGPSFEGRRGSRGDGPSARGRQGGPPEGHRKPDPNHIFDRFDSNEDDQLSLEEFKELANKMREMHERFGRHEGRGFDRDRQGPPRRGGREGSGRGGPPRGENRDGASLDTPVEDDGSV